MLSQNFMLLLFGTSTILSFQLTTSENLVCFETGQCSSGYLLGTSKTTDQNGCLEYCKSDNECGWFTFHKTLQLCDSMANCSKALDDVTCNDCISGQRQCNLADGQQPVCFVSGECSSGLHLDSTQAENENECLLNCKANPECHWFSFYPTLKLCEILGDCPVIDNVSCPDCISGEQRCNATEPPICFVPGECEGNRVSGVVASDNQEFCLEKCKELAECQWFTYLADFGACYFFSDCVAIDESCANCVSGERRCETGGGEEGQGFVAFMVGGVESKSVDLFSPEGGCTHQLASIPFDPPDLFRPIVAYMSEKIIVCGGTYDNRNCWTYDLMANTWAVLTNSDHSHNYQPGEIYEGKIYIVDHYNPEVLDVASLTWGKWPTTPTDSGLGPCAVTWRDSLILLGGNGDTLGVQKFDHITQKWTDVNSDPPFSMWYSACHLLPNDQILVVGASLNMGLKSVTLYNPETDVWTQLPDGLYNRRGANLVTLAGRIFLIGGEETDVIEEFDYISNTWSSLEVKLPALRLNQATLALPARLFKNVATGCNGVVEKLDIANSHNYHELNL